MIREVNLLRDYQEEMITRVREAWMHHRSVMVQMPTGTGKTHVLATIVKDVVSGRAGKVLVLAHRIELISQISQTLSSFGIAHGVMGNGEPCPVMVASVQTVSRRLDRLDFWPDLVIVDEAHHALARTYRVLWEQWPEAKFLGLTATPCRMNRAGFTDLFEVLVCSWSIAKFVEKGVLSVFDYVSILPDSEEQRLIDSLEKRGADGDYQVKEMDQVLNRRPSIERLYHSLMRYAPGKKGIVYAISIEHARQIADFYSQQGIRAVAIDSRTPMVERQRLVEEFRADKLQVLVNVDVFSEGFDCPAVEFVQMARPTLSLAKYLQQVGRGLRKGRDKKVCVLIDNVGLYRVFGLPVVPWDWESMFRGELAGKGVPPTKAEPTEMPYVRQRPENEEPDKDMGMVMSHEVLLAKLGEWNNGPVTTERKKPALTAWQDQETGLWGLKRGRKVLTEAVYVRVFDMQEDVAAVRFHNHGCGLVDEKGAVLWRKEDALRMKFMRNRLLQVQEADGKEKYVDLCNLQVYASKPEVRRYGSFEMLKVRHLCYSRTKEVYASEADYERILIADKGFYLSVFEGTGRYFCLLAGDEERFYRYRGTLADGSILVEDDAGVCYQVAEGTEKRYVGDREAIDSLLQQIEKRLEVEAEEKRQRILEEYREAGPYRAGMKWGLKVGNRMTVPPIYRMVKPPVGKYCVVEMNYGQWGVISIDGRVMIEPKYQSVSLSTDGEVLLTDALGRKKVERISL